MKTIKTIIIRPKNLNGKSIFQLGKWNKRAIERGVIADKCFARAENPKRKQIFAGISADCDRVAGEIRVELANRNIGGKAIRCSIPKKKQKEAEFYAEMKTLIAAS